MRNKIQPTSYYNIVAVLSLFLLLFNMNACKSSENASSKEIKILTASKTPIVRGIGNKGVKISIVLEKVSSVQIDSIVFNGKAKPVDETKELNHGVLVESYFYEDNKRVIGKEPTTNIINSNSCQLIYTVKKKQKTILIPTLDLKKSDNTLWK